MHLIILAAIFIAAIYGPSLWANRVIKKYNRDEYFSGTGATLAKLIAEHQGLSGIAVEVSDMPDHYDPSTKTVRLNKENNRRSLSSVVIAAHEMGHAIQDAMEFRPLRLRSRYIKTAKRIEKAGMVLMMIFPMFTALTRLPAAGFFLFLTALATLSVPVIVHLLTLPVEFDASFNRALPLLRNGNYIPEDDYAAAKSILLACALTYVAAAMADLLNIWRWIRVLRR